MKYCIIICIMFFLLSGTAFALKPSDVNISNGSGVPVHIIAELKIISAKAGDTNISISSTERSVKEQVEVMIDYYIECSKNDINTQKRKENSKCGVAHAKKVYHNKCNSVLDLYQPPSKQPRNKNISLMTKKLTKELKALGKNRPCMKHVIVPGIKSKNYALDIKPSSVKNAGKFYEAVKKSNVVIQNRFFYPPISGKPKSKIKESAFHLEFPRFPRYLIKNVRIVK